MTQDRAEPIERWPSERRAALVASVLTRPTRSNTIDPAQIARQIEEPRIRPDLSRTVSSLLGHDFWLTATRCSLAALSGFLNPKISI